MIYREDTRDYEFHQSRVCGHLTTCVVLATGVSFTIKDLEAKYGLSNATIAYRLKCMLPFDDVVYQGRLPSNPDFYPEKRLEDVLTDAIKLRNEAASSKPDYIISWEKRVGGGKPVQMMTYQGQTFSVAERAAQLGINRCTCKYRISAGKKYAQVFSPPVKSDGSNTVSSLMDDFIGGDLGVNKLLYAKTDVFPAHDPSPLYNAEHLYAANSAEQGVAA